MMKRMKITRNALLAALMCLAMLPGISLAGSLVNVSTIPGTIDMGGRFNGIDLQVRGTVPSGSSVIVRFTGEPSELNLRQKGKVFGLLWMNVGTVQLSNVPKACIIDTTQPFGEMGPAAGLYSLEHLVRNVESESGEDSGDIDIPKELLLLKQQEGLFHQAEQGIILGPEKDGVAEFSAKLSIPSGIAPGNYLVEVVAIQDGKLVGRTTEAITAQMVGFPEWLSHLAFQKSLLYGVLATVIALVSGLAIGLIFQSRGAH